MIDLPDRTVWTRDGVVDLVVLERFTAGRPQRLTTAERRAIVHMLAEAGTGPAAIAKRVAMNTAEVKRELAKQPPADHLGRPITLTRTGAEQWQERPPSLSLAISSTTPS